MAGSSPTAQAIEQAIVAVRGHRLLLDVDLARMYGVETRVLIQNVRRKARRFPSDFMLTLTAEVTNLRSRNVISRRTHGGRRSLPLAFTEQGVAMLASILNSPGAIAVNIEIVRVFVRLRHAITVNAELALRGAAVEASLSEHRNETGGHFAEHERRIRMILEAIQQLMDDGGPSADPPSPIGFQVGDT